MNPLPEPPRVGVLGARSLVGRFLLPLVTRCAGGVLAVSRVAQPPAPDRAPGVTWCQPGAPPPTGMEPVTHWVSLCPLWAVPEHAGWLAGLGVRRLVAVSSMSVETKAESPDSGERAVSERLAEAEAWLGAWADDRGVTLTILRPTMIYDGASDRNVAAIAAVVRRCGFFPLCGEATGRRQPVHAGDVATACLAALEHDEPERCYPLSGGEALPFRELVLRTCRAHGLPARTVSLPPWAWSGLVALARGLGLIAGVGPGSGLRMNADLSCDHADATRDLGFKPRPFVPGGGTIGAAADIVDSRPPRPQADR